MYLPGDRGGTEDASRAWLLGRNVQLVMRRFFHAKVLDDTDEKGARFLACTPLGEI